MRVLWQSMILSAKTVNCMCTLYLLNENVKWWRLSFYISFFWEDRLPRRFSDGRRTVMTHVYAAIAIRALPVVPTHRFQGHHVNHWLQKVHPSPLSKTDSTWKKSPWITSTYYLESPAGSKGRKADKMFLGTSLWIYIIWNPSTTNFMQVLTLIAGTLYRCESSVQLFSSTDINTPPSMLHGWNFCLGRRSDRLRKANVNCWYQIRAAPTTTNQSPAVNIGSPEMPASMSKGLQTFYVDFDTS